MFEILHSRGLLPFSGVMRVQFLAGSMSVQRMFHASPGLAADSLMSWRNAATLGFVPAMSWSISVSRGMKGRFSIRLYRGGLNGICFHL